MLRGNGAPLGWSAEINFTDIGHLVDAFKTLTHKEVGPTDCP